MRGTAPVAAAVLILVVLSGCGDDPSVVTGTGTVTTSAGTLDVECRGRYKVHILDSSPAAGFTTHLIVSGPAAEASLIFENPDADDVRVAIHCRDGQPEHSEWTLSR
jgi:hypothetical protein